MYELKAQYHRDYKGPLAELQQNPSEATFL